MKAVILQPAYPNAATPAAAQACVQWLREQLEHLTPGEQDLVLLPEYATAPGLEQREQLREFATTAGETLRQAAAAAARRLQCLVVLNGPARTGALWFNRTGVFAATGAEICTYDKVHLTAVERDTLGLTPGATIPVCAHAGLRLGFATCFDLYFPEHFAALAAQGADVILCPSYQRSETAERLRTMAQIRALDTGAHLLRSSYAMPNPAIGGHSLVAAPDGSLLADAGDRPGVLRVEFDPHAKFVKPASHGQPPVEHRRLLESHRRPALYRPHPEESRQLNAQPFPRLCAHRGLSQACPENTLPAFAAAIAAGAHELELDLWLSRDGVLVVCHDETVDRTSNGRGRINDLDWADLRRLDAGSWHDPAWAGVTMPRLEEVLELAAGRVGLNLHLKESDEAVRRTCDLVLDRGLLETAYLALESEAALENAIAYAPHLDRACLANQADADACLATAIRHGCKRLQYFHTVTAAQIRRAHDAGLICNVFWADEPDAARRLTADGIDVILTNCTHHLVAAGFAPRS